VDWSAASVPRVGPDSIWIAASRERADAVNCPTRAQAVRVLSALLRAYVRSRLCVLVGWDFPLGYPDGFARRLGARGPLGTWRILARLVRDGEDNRSNRFEAAAALNARAGTDLFWGCPAGTRGLCPTRPALALPELRLCELALRERGLRPHSPWKLFTSGSCGSQALTGLPRLLALREARGLRAHSCVWPLETGFRLPRRRPLIVHAEIWPTALPFDAKLHPVRDGAQVLSAVKWMREEDAAGRLATRFGPPQGVDGSVAQREGWVL
jgi:hypothetical protein